MGVDLTAMMHLNSGGRTVVAAVAATLLIVFAGARASAQTPLAEVAKKEADRRKAAPPTGKVYTAKDLPASAQKPAPPVTSETLPVDPVAAATADQPPAEAPKPEVDARNEAWWKDRIMGARGELRRNEIFAEALQSRINALTREFALPLGGAKRIAVGEQRAEALTELGRVKEEVERGKKQIADIEEEARKAGVPPGWLR